MGSVNIKAKITPLVPTGTPSPLRVSSPPQIRSSAVLPSGFSASLATDIDNIVKAVNNLHTTLQQAPPVTQLLLTNQAGQVTAAFGQTTFQGVLYTNYLSEIHVGNPQQTQDPTQALFNANLDGSVSIGQNGWIDVHDPFEGNAAWIGTQFDTIQIINAVNNGSGEIRITTASPHTLGPGNLSTVVRGLNLWNVPNGNGRWPVTVIDPVTLDLNGSVWSGPYVYIDSDGDIDPTPDLPQGIPTFQATVDRVLQVTAVAQPGGAGTVLQVTTALPHGYETGDQVTLPAYDSSATQWIVTVVDASNFTLDGSTATPLFTATTCLRYYAGMLAQTIAIGASFAGYSLRAFADGTLRIKNATIELSSAAGTVVLDPSVPEIVLSDAANQAKIVIDASVPDIKMYDSTGTLSVTIDSNGTITARTVNSTTGFNGTAILAKLTGGGANGSLTFVNGLATAYSAPT